MTTLTLTHVPTTRAEAPRLTTSASREDVEAAAMVYLPGIGVRWAVTA